MKDLTKRLMEVAEEMENDMIVFAQKIIQTNSISGNEGKVADLYLNEMKKLGYDEVFRDDVGNAIGYIKGVEDGPSIMFNSHMDHVSEGNPDNWEGYDPYGGVIDMCAVDDQEKTKTETAECIHGRAASDVKGGAATQVYAGGIIARLKKEGYPIKGTYIFSGVVLEESSGVGIRHLVEHTFPERKMDFDALVSSEATSLKLYLGHRGRTEYLLTTYGRMSHGSAPWLGVNAIYLAVPVIEQIKNKLYPSLPEDEDLGKASVSLNIIECLPGALSTVPDQCMLSLDRRTLPSEDLKEVKKQFQDIIDGLCAECKDFKADVKIKTDVDTTYMGTEHDVIKSVPGWKIPKEHALVKACADAIEAVGQEVKYDYWDFSTDMAYTAGECHKPAIGYSPMQEQYAHTPYDKVRIDFMKEALRGNASIYIHCMNKSKKEIGELL